MSILLFGKNGQLGWELQRSLATLGEVIALGTDSTDLCGDFRNLDGIAHTVRAVKPKIIVNAAAYTDVDKAESEPDLAYLINAKAPGILAEAASECGAWFVHYSSDYVFDGKGDQPWLETDMTGPLSVYGDSKLKGEQAVQAAGPHHLIFRSTWIYAAHGKNFPKTILRLAKERDQLRVVDDQIGAPTGADLIADVTAHMLRLALQRPAVGGLYHLSAKGETSWYDYARLVLGFAQQSGVEIRVGPDAIMPISSSDFGSPAERPQNSRLDTNKLLKTLAIYNGDRPVEMHLPDWKTGVARMLSEVLESYGLS